MRTIVALALAFAFAAGVFLFPHALEPGRAERDGITLDLLQPGTDRLAPGDWYLGSSAIQVSRATDGARVNIDRGTLIALTSRSLAVVPRACYRLSFTGGSRGGLVHIQVADENLRTDLGGVSVPRGGAGTRASVTFTPGDRRRISLLVRAKGAATALIGGLRFDRIPHGDCPRP